MIHPAPGSDGKPSFTALVASVDSNQAKYVAHSRVQTSRQEIIDDLQAMSKVISLVIQWLNLSFELLPRPRCSNICRIGEKLKRKIQVTSPPSRLSFIGVRGFTLIPIMKYLIFDQMVFRRANSKRSLKKVVCYL